ncbi:ABC transporter ATP-binding protein [Candidatus Nitrospira bockiana]
MLRLEHVSLTLGEREVLHDISFDVRPGETKVILGASGSGKTTILKLLLRLYTPDRGAIRVRGRDIVGLDERTLASYRRQMAMVFQSAALFDSLTVRENVGYRLWEHGTLPDAEIERIVEESLRFVALEDTLDKMPAELSGGMKKRVGIARALASGAEILLYDEPTAGLDPINTCLISRLILKLKAKRITQVVVTHDLETAYRVADRLILIDKGRAVFEGTAQELQASPLPAVRGFVDPGSLFPDDDRPEAALRPPHVPA